MNRTKAAWSSITVGLYVCGKTTERGSLSHSFSCTLELFSFSKKMNLDMTAVRLYDFLSCAGPRSSHQRQRFSTSHVVFYTWVCLQRPIHRPHPAERARCCIDRYRLVLIGTSIIFFECLTKVCSSFSPFEIAPTNEGIEPSNIRLSPMRDSARFLHTAPIREGKPPRTISLRASLQKNHLCMKK